jgi:signal transduction histidine kinase
MTFTGRIRLYLIVVAVLPPLLVMGAVYVYSQHQTDISERQQAQRSVNKFEVFHRQFLTDLNRDIEELTASAELQQLIVQVAGKGRPQHQIDPRQYRLNFLEVIDSSGTVVSTFHRLGLLGERPLFLNRTDSSVANEYVQAVEYDIEGAHAAIAKIIPLDRYRLYCGKFLDRQYLTYLGTFLDAEVDVHYVDPDIEQRSPLTRMTTGTLYEIDRHLAALLAGGEEAGFYLTASFFPSLQKPVFLSIVAIGGVVAFLSTLAALLLGVYITGRAKREISNLVNASGRVAKGDFSTPVMAYEEGEFAQLADSLSEMMLKLKTVQAKLAASEKIAAWQAMGRKVAHEIKNPLTPIAVSTDDLTRSYIEKLPEFDRILRETTQTIKAEVNRMTKLLDQFVGFARMAPPNIRRVALSSITDPVKNLYRHEIEQGQLTLKIKTQRSQLQVDPDSIAQVLINLIKNGFESSHNARVTLAIEDAQNGVAFRIEDNGPGFAPERLQNSFEPYVSTKEKGSGLGLVISYRIVHDHGGTIELYNHLEGGAGVVVTIPA